MPKYDVTVVIPTTGELNRKISLMKAISCVRSQKKIKAIPLVVLNGVRYDIMVRQELEAMGDIQFIYLEKGSLPLAMVCGRYEVKTPFFSFLDDDDEYTDQALFLRIKRMLEDASISIVVSNGIRRINHKDIVLYDNMKNYSAEPLMALITKGNWLASCGGLFRTSKITLDFFDPEQKYYEWTLVAFKLALSNYNIKFIEDKTFIINDTPCSLSKTDESAEAELKFIYRLMSYSLSKRAWRSLSRKRIDTLHSLSDHYLLKKNIKEARRYHMASLFSYYGLFKYFIYSRHLIRGK